jgi:predicted nucleic acid-binding protein
MDFKPIFKKLKEEEAERKRKQEEDDKVLQERLFNTVCAYITDAMEQGKDYFELHGRWDSSVIAALHNAGCTTQRIYDESQMTNNTIQSGWKITFPK